MRLYTVIDNKTFVKQILLNQAINASVKASDFKYNSFNSSISSYIDRFLYYTNREDWNENAIYCCTCPSSFEEKTISDKEVVISFEASEKDVILLDYDKFLDYTYELDNLVNNKIESDSVANNFKEYFSNVEQNVLDIKDFYNAIAFVNEILSNSVKNAVVKKTNPIVPLLQMNKNKLHRSIPMQYFSEGNRKVRELLKHKPQNVNVENKKFLITASENDREK